jgi:acetate kinase
MVNRKAGMRGVSGLSGDMRQLHAVSASNPNASLAVEMFCYSVRKQIAAMIAVLEGIDMIVFTGGIGENDPLVRSLICSGLAWAGVRSDTASQQHVAGTCDMRVVPSREDDQIARLSSQVVRNGTSDGCRPLIGSR